MPKIDLAFIARQLDRVIGDTGGLKDDMTVVMARLDRIEATVRGDRDKMRATLFRRQESTLLAEAKQAGRRSR